MPVKVPADDEACTIDTDALDRMGLEARYRRFVDSVQPVTIRTAFNVVGAEADDPIVRDEMFRHGAEALADFIVREPGVLRHRVTTPDSESLCPSSIMLDVGVQMIRDPKVRDTFTAHMERERKRARQEGAQEVARLAEAFIRGWACQIDPTHIQRNDALRGLREALSKVWQENQT
jgi:hypothetical protein